MMSNIQFDYSKALGFIDEQEVLSLQDTINTNYKAIYDKTGKGNDFLGWVDLPSKTDTSLLKQIEQTANSLRAKSEVCVVIGIGGSYLGARAVIEALSPAFNLLKKKKGNPVILYAGHNISEDYLTQLLQVLNEKDYSIVVISKSGTTTEPALAFRLLRRHLEEKYGEKEAATRIVAITDKARGALKQLATEKGYQTYVVPDDVGGRYSVLTPVGLLPIAIAGFDINKLIAGAQQMESFVKEDYSIGKNPVSAYAAVRNVLYNNGKSVEIMVNYEPNLYFFTEWWKQLYGESEGKENKGIFPAGVSNTTDLHSMGQYIQEGVRNLFETVVSVKNPDNTLLVPEDADNLDKLNYLAGKRINEVNKMAELGTTIAHVDGGVPNLRISIPEISESVLGELIYFYEMACAVSGYLLDVNPFDQPGVEAYKRNMFALLGKPGFESETEAIKKRLNQ
ncbi:MAG: glucose-6-phosphate isomerase [Bacteroidetes bacterium]|nr:MAG: glucose-6-phosphate isomerase [Bacteroidota bacterium]